MTMADFQPFLRQKFAIHVVGAAPVEIELAEIHDRSRTGLESFSLLFQGTPDRVFPQGSYQMSHPEIGTLLLFLGPVETTGKIGIHYEAVFTRLTSP
jgi:hypothetical protein